VSEKSNTSLIKWLLDSGNAGVRPAARSNGSPPSDLTLAKSRERHARTDATPDTGESDNLGLNPGTLYARMKKLGIQRPAAD
jgi:hypothetical protein